MPPPNPTYPFVKVKCRHYSRDRVRQMSVKWHPSINFFTSSSCKTHLNKQSWKHQVAKLSQKWFASVGTENQNNKKNPLLLFVLSGVFSVGWTEANYPTQPPKSSITTGHLHSVKLRAVSSLQAPVIWLKICEPVNFLLRGRNHIRVSK